MGFIRFSDMLKIMPDGPFDVEVITLNLREGTGGKKVIYKNVTLLAGGNSRKNSKKNPRNYMNLTRTVKVPGRSRPITLNTLIITKFNNERVFI